MYKSYIPYLQHILDECSYIQSVVTPDMDREQFFRDETLKRAVTRSLSIIGEATKKIPADVKYAWQSILFPRLTFESARICQGPVPCHGLQTLDKAATYTR